MIEKIKMQNELPNVYFLNKSRDLSDLVDYAQANNMSLFYIDGDAILNKEMLLQRLGAAIKSPISYRQSWNKFRADITDLSWINTGNGFCLVYENYKNLLTNNPKDWITFLGTMMDATEFWRQTKTPLTVFFFDPSRVNKENKASSLSSLAHRQLSSYIVDAYFLNYVENVTDIINYSRENNIEFFHLDGREIKRKRDLILQVGDKLRFPDDYEKNWDALYDLMTDLNYWIAPRDGYILLYEGFENLLLSNPKEWGVFLEILLDAVEFYQHNKPPLYIFFKYPDDKKSEDFNTKSSSGRDKAFGKQYPDSIFANSELFTKESYHEFMAYINSLGERLMYLHAAMSQYPKEKRFESPESNEWDETFAKYKQTSNKYRLRLSLHTIAICPYCKTSIVKPFDHFSLLGLYDHLHIDYTYVGRIDSDKDDIYLGRHCAHALFTMQFVNLNGREPDDLPIWAAKHLYLPSSYRLSSAPCILVWPLIAQRTSAVIHALPIGRYDDWESRHQYTSYFVTYFADGKNSNISSFWNAGEENTLTPALYGDIYRDYDLLKWVKAKRLFWVDPNNMKNIVNQPLAYFPYRNIQPQGWYRMTAGGVVDGPHPYESRWIWSGQPPEHDKSFPGPIDV